MHALKGFLEEARRRKIFRTAALYVVSAWVALQIADLAFPGLGVPPEAIRYVWVGGFIGLPLVLLFGWRYQVTSAGIVRSSGEGALEHRPLRRTDYLVLGALLFVGGASAFELGSRIARQASPLGAATEANSIAVLPLENLTGDPEQAYFAAGMHDALITTLSRIGALRVISRSSARAYENVSQPIRQTARELGVGKIIEGSVFRTGDRVRINVQLIDARTDANLWSENYERRIEDVLTLQSDIARDVAEQVRVELTSGEVARLASSRRVDPETYETYLRGMFHLNQYTPEGMERGLGYLNEAVASDPDDPLAYAGLALGYTLIGHSPNPSPGVWLRAREAALRALELDSLFAEAHAALAEIRLYHDWDWDEAERSFRRALQLNPNLEFAHAHYAWYHTLMGNPELAVEHMRRAQQVAPLTPIHTAWLGWLHWAYGRPDEAIAEARRALEINPNFIWGLHVLSGAYREKGMYEESLAVQERLIEMNPGVGRWGLGFTHAALGDTAATREVIAELAVNPGQKDLVYLGLLNASIGEVEEGLRWLEAAYDARVDWLPWVAAAPESSIWDVEALRGEPRFEELVASLALPPR